MIELNEKLTESIVANLEKVANLDKDYTDLKTTTKLKGWWEDRKGKTRAEKRLLNEYAKSRKGGFSGTMEDFMNLTEDARKSHVEAAGKDAIESARSGFEYNKTKGFLKRHWGKMLVGGLAAGALLSAASSKPEQPQEYTQV